jgi:low temperature requirement protein LtrA
MNLPALAHPPRLWTANAHGERRATWMELFFDLIFVAAVAEVGAPLATEYNLAGLLRRAFLFVLIWWAWNGHTLYSTGVFALHLHRVVLVVGLLAVCCGQTLLGIDNAAELQK